MLDILLFLKNKINLNNDNKLIKKKLAFLRPKRKRRINFYKKKGKEWNLRVRRKYAGKLKFLTKRYRKKTDKKHFFRLKKVVLRLLLRQTKNNFYSTFMRGKRRVLWTLSCGIIGLKGPQRSTPFGAEQLGRFTLNKLIKQKVRKAAIVLKSGITYHMRGCLRYLKSSKIFTALFDLIPRPHNGLRKRKLRRL